MATILSKKLSSLWSSQTYGSYLVRDGNGTTYCFEIRPDGVSSEYHVDVSSNSGRTRVILPEPTMMESDSAMLSFAWGQHFSESKGIDVSNFQLQLGWKPLENGGLPLIGHGLHRLLKGNKNPKLFTGFLKGASSCLQRGLCSLLVDVADSPFELPLEAATSIESSLVGVPISLSLSVHAKVRSIDSEYVEQVGDMCTELGVCTELRYCAQIEQNKIDEVDGWTNVKLERRLRGTPESKALDNKKRSTLISAIKKILSDAQETKSLYIKQSTAPSMQVLSPGSFTRRPELILNGDVHNTAVPFFRVVTVTSNVEQEREVKLYLGSYGAPLCGLLGTPESSHAVYKIDGTVCCDKKIWASIFLGSTTVIQEEVHTLWAVDTTVAERSKIVLL